MDSRAKRREDAKCCEDVDAIEDRAAIAAYHGRARGVVGLAMVFPQQHAAAIVGQDAREEVGAAIQITLGDTRRLVVGRSLAHACVSSACLTARYSS